ncbi:MAG: lipid A biosynthesis protein, partial [Nitrospina sp.]|nr:lipid A biosynthesis protein [Nitrospina sp.]
MTVSQWLVIGFIGQALFGARFIIQWIVSEKKGESTIPLAFWYCSIGGAVVL